jgi:hypothetical protein
MRRQKRAANLFFGKLPDDLYKIGFPKLMMEKGFSRGLANIRPGLLPQSTDKN